MLIHLFQNEQQRLKVLQLILKNEPTADNVEIATLAKHTEGFSGSDLQELCRNASIYRIRDYLYSQYVFKRFVERKSNIVIFNLKLRKFQKLKSRCINFYNNVYFIATDSNTRTIQTMNTTKNFMIPCGPSRWRTYSNHSGR